ncbi:hypothetical protein CHELA41_23345 [Hyphomicrobiales bacterium]|nr:hypothetical protein CHELA41_23345 [Hyphomicrobiales bacterium]
MDILSRTEREHFIVPRFGFIAGYHHDCHCMWTSPCPRATAAGMIG